MGEDVIGLVIGAALAGTAIAVASKQKKDEGSAAAPEPPKVPATPAAPSFTPTPTSTTSDREDDLRRAKGYSSTVTNEGGFAGLVDPEKRKATLLGG